MKIKANERRDEREEDKESADSPDLDPPVQCGASEGRLSPGVFNKMLMERDKRCPGV